MKNLKWKQKMRERTVREKGESLGIRKRRK